MTGSRVGPITVASPKAWAQLRHVGVLVSFRSRERTQGETWVRRERGGHAVGDVRVERLERARDPAAIGQGVARHASVSGFADARAWLEAIEEYHGAATSGAFYRIVWLGARPAGEAET